MMRRRNIKMNKELEKMIEDNKERFAQEPFIYTEQSDVDFMQEVEDTILKLESKVDNLMLVIALLVLVLTYLLV